MNLIYIKFNLGQSLWQKFWKKKMNILLFLNSSTVIYTYYMNDKYFLVWINVLWIKMFGKDYLPAKGHQWQLNTMTSCHEKTMFWQCPQSLC